MGRYSREHQGDCTRMKTGGDMWLTVWRGVKNSGTVSVQIRVSVAVWSTTTQETVWKMRAIIWDNIMEITKGHVSNESG